VSKIAKTVSRIAQFETRNSPKDISVHGIDKEMDESKNSVTRKISMSELDKQQIDLSKMQRSQRADELSSWRNDAQSSIASHRESNTTGHTRHQ